jgi:hypothetical protein
VIIDKIIRIWKVAADFLLLSDAVLAVDGIRNYAKWQIENSKLLRLGVKITTDNNVSCRDRIFINFLKQPRNLFFPLCPDSTRQIWYNLHAILVSR